VWAFLYGWSNFSVINTASITAIAVGFAKYIGFFTPLSETGIRIIAIVSIIGLTVLNCRGVRLGATTQNVLTTLKIGALIALIVTSFVIPGGSVSHFQPLWPSEPVGNWIGAFGRRDGGGAVGVRRLDRVDVCRQRDRESRSKPAAARSFSRLSW